MAAFVAAVAANAALIGAEREATSLSPATTRLVGLTPAEVSFAPLPEFTVGNIQIKGATVTGGYLAADGELDRSCFAEGQWFKTGDIGFRSSPSTTRTMTPGIGEPTSTKLRARS